MCKICEILIANMIKNHIIKITSYTTDTLVSYLFVIFKLLLRCHLTLYRQKERKKILGISLDLQAAYDSIYIRGIIFIYAQIGISSQILRWLHRFLTI